VDGVSVVKGSGAVLLTPVLELLDAPPLRFDPEPLDAPPL
jgi:hypothetical protein